MSFEANAYIRIAPIADEATREAVADLLSDWNDEDEPTADLFRGPAEVHQYDAPSVLYSSWSPLGQLKALGVAFLVEQEPGDTDEGPGFGEWAVFVPGVGEDSGDDIAPGGCQSVLLPNVTHRLDEILSGWETADHRDGSQAIGAALDVVDAVKAYRAELAKAGAEELRAAFEALCKA
jgi:hypothetical protein